MSRDDLQGPEFEDSDVRELPKKQTASKTAKKQPVKKTATKNTASKKATARKPRRSA